ncbi:MAG TPA: roadblock/LC7 domain-containing protein [Thermoplasmata archaeon]|jgi:hypothetical protein|nr:roadblock/LC7 domain-containing protein [Thermoplasmata archaeon]
MALETTLQQIRDAGATAVAVVSRDGTVLAADLPPGVSRETFSIMCATIHGAGMTVSNEMRRSAPKRISLESAEGRILITEAGRRALVVFVFPSAVEPNEAQLKAFLDAVARDTG